MGLFDWMGRLLTDNLSLIEAQVAAQPHEPLPFPITIELDDGAVTLRLLEPADRDDLLAFARSLPEEDLLFLRRDITRAEEVDAWLRDAEEGYTETILALTAAGEIAGYATVASDRMSWSRHVAELRVLTAPEMRGRGLGRLMTAQAFAIARQRGVRKMLAQMTTDQGAARRAFERMGFTSEAVLRGQVIDRDGKLHDLRIMSLNVDEFQQRLQTARIQMEISSRSASMPM